MYASDGLNGKIGCLGKEGRTREQAGMPIRMAEMLSTLDGCAYARITHLPNSKVEAVETALFTMSGGTDAEIQANRAAIFRALRIPEPKETERHPSQER